MKSSACKMNWLGKLTTLLVTLVISGAMAFAQTKTVTGTVIDDLGEPMIGVNVSVKGTTNGTITDIDGNYTINDASANDILVFSFVGMNTQEIKIGNQTKINVTMAEDSQMLEDVVVVGYGTMRKKDLTGSVSTVNSEALTAVPVASVTEALTGKMAGVQITTTEGSPDAEMKIRVRGGGSITGDNTPLFIVDGFPVESISDIPASDIEDMTVLKDASSTAIYGSRGANGVILVTTKSGKEGKLSVSYNAYFSLKNMAKKLNTLSGSDYVKWQWELAQLRDSQKDYTNMFGNYQDMDLYDTAPTNDWQDQVFGETGYTFNHNISVNGGTEKTKFNVGYAYMTDKAIMKNSGFRRDNASLKLQHKANKKVTLDFSMRYSNTGVDGAGANESKNEVSSADSRMKDVMIYTPFNFTDLSDGYDPDLQLTNPLISVRDNDRKQSRQTLDMNASVTYEVIKNLKVKSEVGLQHYYNEDRRYYGVSTYNSRVNGNNLPMANYVDSKRKTFRNTNTINYDFKDVFGKNSSHHLNVLLGQELVRKTSNANTVKLFNFPADFTAKQTWQLSSQGQTLVNPDYYINANDNLISWFGRFNYDFKGRYYVSATFRADGSSKFADGNRWGFFPSAALAWRISDEKFMEWSKGWLEDMKIRGSFGMAGNNNIPSDQTATIWGSSSTSWLNGNNYNDGALWATGTQMANPELTWETTITRNLGVDFSLLGNKLTGSFEYYWNSTKDLLINFPVTGTGYATQYRNLGKTSNTGAEISLTYHIVDNKTWGLSVSGNVSFNKNKVDDLGGLESINASCGWASTFIQNDYQVRVGDPIGQIYGYKNAGRYEVSDFDIEKSIAANKWVLKEGVVSDADVIGAGYLRPGALKLDNTDGSDDNAVNTSDVVKIGDTNPTATGGFAINARAYGFDLAANFTYSIGNDVYNANKIEYTTSGQYKYRNMIDIMAAGERWNNLNAAGELLNWANADELAAQNKTTSMWSPYMSKPVLTDWAIEDGSFLRLQTLTVGYTLPTNIVKKVRMSSLRFYFTCNNVFCLTNYTGFDPEVSTRNRTALTPGVDYSAYPKSRQFVFGLNVNF